MIVIETYYLNINRVPVYLLLDSSNLYRYITYINNFRSMDYIPIFEQQLCCDWLWHPVLLIWLARAGFFSFSMNFVGEYTVKLAYYLTLTACSSVHARPWSRRTFIHVIEPNFTGEFVTHPITCIYRRCGSFYINLTSVRRGDSMYIPNIHTWSSQTWF